VASPLYATGVADEDSEGLRNLGRLGCASEFCMWMHSGYETRSPWAYMISIRSILDDIKARLEVSVVKIANESDTLVSRLKEPPDEFQIFQSRQAMDTGVPLLMPVLHKSSIDYNSSDRTPTSTASEVRFVQSRTSGKEKTPHISHLQDRLDRDRLQSLCTSHPTRTFLAPS
jgi:hypothetical protein